MGYGFLADCYDSMTTDVDYPTWADYIERQFRRRRSPIHTVLDLACGTGSLSWLLARRGYEMIAVDISPDMLAQARNKTMADVVEAPVFLCQAMEHLDLYGTVDACICMLDSVNHMTESETLLQAFSRVHLFLEPGGLFLFDILSREHLKALDGEMFIDETEQAYCVWRADYEEERDVCTYVMDIFLEKDALWEREQEIHEERAYTIEEIEVLLEAAGFEHIQKHGALKMDPPENGETRIFLQHGKRRHRLWTILFEWWQKMHL